MDDMMVVSTSIRWTIANIASFGGDTDRLVLAEQSAGAHIIMSLMLDVFDDLMCRDKDYPTMS